MARQSTRRAADARHSRDVARATVFAPVASPVGILVWQLIAPGLISVLVLTRQVVPAGVVAAILFACLTVVKLRAATNGHEARRHPALIDLLLTLVGLILSLVYIVILTHPQQSILYRLNFGGYDVGASLPGSFATLAVAIFLSAVELPYRHRMSGSAQSWPPFRKATASVLFVLGTLGLGAVLATSREVAFQNRDTGGLGGLATFAYWGASAFVVYVVVGWRRTDPRVFLLLSAAAIVALLLSGNRSPIALIVLAVLVRLAQARRFRTLILSLAATPIALMLFAYQAIWRGLVARSMPADPLTILKSIGNDPGASLVRLGLDSIDGHALTVDLLKQGFEARPLDPLTAVLNFVPRALWAGKPTLLGGEIGRSYLGTNGSGIFLSGPGYLSLVTGSTLLGAVVFIVAILVLKRMTRAPRHPFFIVIASYLAARFTIAGDAFDIFLALQLVVIVSIGEAIGRMTHRDDLNQETP